MDISILQSVPHNITGNYSTIQAIFETANTVTGGWFGILLIVVIEVILFGTMRLTAENHKAFLGSMIVTNLITLFFRALNIVPDGIMILMIVGLIVAFIYYERAG